MRPSLDQLEVLLAIVDAGSFRAASVRLRCTQSSISYAVAQLEAALDCRLFDRTGARPMLNRNGEAVVAQARVVLGEAHRLGTLVAPPNRDEPVVPLALVVDTIVAPKLLAPLLLEATHRLPQLELSVRSESKFSLTELLANGTCDVGLSGSSGGVPIGLVREPLRTFALVPVAAPTHALARVSRLDRAKLAEHLQIAVSERSVEGRRRPLESVVGRRYLRVSDVWMKLELIRGGLGWGFLPWDFVEPELHTGALTQLSAPRADVGTLALVYRAASGPTPFGLLVRERLGPRKARRRPRRS